MILAGTIAALLVILAAFPWGSVATRAAGPLSRAIGRPVTIAGGRRVDHFSFVPTVELRGVSIAQPAWAGPGAMAQIATVQISAPILPLLWGDFRPRAIMLQGVRLELRRDRSGRSNWAGEAKLEARRKQPLDLSRLTLGDVRAHLIDRKRRVDLLADVRSDANGLVVQGRGKFRDAPLTLSLRGAPLTGGSGKDYPADVTIASPLVKATGHIRMAQALSLDRFDARLETSGQDLTYFDDLVEAGLFPTQDFALAGTIRHDGDRWEIQRLAGTIGRSRLSATGTVERRGERTRLDAKVTADTLDFGDFASDAQRARGAAQASAIGPRVIPDTRIELDAIAQLDGTLRIDARHLLGEPKSPLRALHATATLDRRRLEITPLVVPLREGVARGRLLVDDRGAVPRLSVDLTIGQGATIHGLLLGDDAVMGPLSARIRLTGQGRTLRTAIAASNGKVGLAVRGGTMRKDYATFLGGDLLKSIGQLVSGGGARVPVRCLAGRFVAKGGRLVPAPLVLDATIARGDGAGVIDLHGERIDLAIRGRAARPGLIQSVTPVSVNGTLSRPKLDIRPPRAAERGKTGMFDRVGALIKGLKTRGDNPAPAQPADCAALIRQALG